MNTIDKRNIMKAVLHGTLTDVKNTLKKHKLVQDESYFDYELLKVALSRKEYMSRPIIKFLLKQGCRVRNPNKQKDRTPLHISIFLNIDIIKKLLARKASIYEKNKKNETVLFAAFKQARHSATDILLNYCGMKDLDPADEDDMVHFYIACVRGHLYAINLFLMSGFDINSPLHLDSKYNGVGLASYEHKKTCLDLPDNKPLYRSRTEDSDSSDTERYSYDSSDSESDDSNLLYTRIRMICTVYPSHNPLHFAVKYAFEEVVELLLTHGADCNKKDKDGKTPLHLACETSKCKKTNIIEMLLEHKACTTVQDDNGDTPIHIAFYNKNSEKEKIFDTLLAKVQWGLTNCTDHDYGISHFHIACTRNNVSAINDFLNSGVPIDHHVDFGVYKAYTALHFAILYNQKEVVALLLKRKADVNFKTNEGHTSLHLACAYNGEKFIDLEHNYDNPMNESWTLNRSDQFDIIKLLIDHGADLNVKDCFGKSPLHHACKFYGDCSSYFFKIFLINEISIRMEEIIKIFLSKKDHGNAHKINPSSVLHILSENVVLKVSEELIAFLITEGADLCAFDDYGLTPLHIAVKSFNKDLVQFFLEHNVNVNIKSENSLIPLQLAISNSNLLYMPLCQDILCMLLEYGSDVNIINENGKTILHDAIESNNYFAVEKLLHYGADINLVEHFPIVNLNNLKIFKIVSAHVLKLMTVGLPVSVNAKNTFNNWDNYFNCVKEIKRMKLEKVDNYTSLYSILRKDQHDLSKHVKNNSLIKIIMNQNIEEKFPLYGYLLKIQFKKGIVRRDVLKSATSSLNRVIKFNLPESCCDLILKHLTNEEITNLKSAI